MKHNDLVRTAMTLDDELDDIKRARIWSRLEDRLAEPEAPPARWPILVGVAAVAALAVLALFGLLGTTPDQTARVLTIPVETTVSSNLGPHTRASLVGPAELELVGAPGPATTVRLRRGTLLADFAGGPGRSLRIEAPGAVIEIVGTLFAVEALDGGSCTSVSHGRVRVTSSTRTVDVGADERYCTSGTSEPQPIEETVKRALERHGAVITAQVEPVIEAPAIATEPVVAMRTPDEPRVAAPPPTAPTATRAALPPSPVTAPTATRAATTPSPSSAATATRSAPAPSPAPAAATPHAIRSTAPTPSQSSSPAPTATRGAPVPSPAPAVTATAGAPGPSPAPATATPHAILSTAPTRSQSSSPASTATSAIRSPAPAPSPEPVVVTAPTLAIVPTPLPPLPVTATDLYRAAETALGSGDLAQASRALDRLVTEFPSSPLVDQAHYEAARIAYKQRSWATARRHLARLAAVPRTPLAEPGHYLSCRIAVETRERGAASCLVEYRKAFPRSPHDLDALALVVQLGHASGGCAAVTNEIAELARRHPNSKHAAAWRARCTEQP